MSTVNGSWNIHKPATQTVWLQLTAGQGPKECGWVVAQLCREVLKDACGLGLSAVVVESLAFDKALRKQDLIEADAYLSMLIRVEGKGADLFAGNWVGSIKWQGESMYRPKHKRINWFVSALVVEIPNVREIDIKDLQREVKVESMRSGGPGGQHVNKTNSAVRITHQPTGIQVRVEADRSQHRNRQLAMERLQMILADSSAKDEKAQDRARWKNHYQVKRGRPTRVFQGVGFDEFGKSNKP